MKAFEIVACLNQLFSEFDKLAEDAGIEKIKTIGDNYARLATKFALDVARKRCATRLGARQRPRPDAEIVGGEVSF